MTWTAARTWVDNELITAALLNQQIRDQFEAVGLHDHSAEPGAVVLTPDRVDLAQQTSAIVSTDPGRFQRTAAGLWYTVGAGQNAFIGPSAPAATPATRALGAGDTDAAAGTHRHAVEVGDTGINLTGTRLYSDSGGVTGTYRTITVDAVVGERAYAIVQAQAQMPSGQFRDVVLRDGNGIELVRYTLTPGGSGVFAVEIPSGGLTLTAAVVNSGTDTDASVTLTSSFISVSRVYVGAGLSP